MEHCPSCEREFRGIFDFPAVYLVKFAVNVDLKAVSYRPFFEQTIFTDPSLLIGHKQAPQAVVELCKTAEGRCAYDGWQWQRRQVPLQNGNSALIYERFKDVRVDLEDKLKPYFSRLERAVGTEVQRSDLLPPFEGSPASGFHIPATEYEFSFHADKNVTGVQRRATIDLFDTKPTGGLMSVHRVVPLAYLEYEGRLKRLVL